MDPLEDVLALLETRGRFSPGLRAGGEWAMEFEAPAGVKFNAVRHGSCRLWPEGTDTPIDLGPGDCFLLTRPRPFTLTSSTESRSATAAVPLNARTVFEAAEGGFARIGAGDEVLLIGGSFTFGERARGLLLDALPAVIHVPAGTTHAETIQWALGQMEKEMLDRPMGAFLVGEHLAVVMLIHVLRLHLATDARHAPGWLAGLADPAVAAALAALHSHPERSWTVAEIAQVSGTSRSTFASRFRSTVGQAPLDYLRHWRIELTARHLRQGDETLASIARLVGYRSDSALSTAFKQVTGMSPRAYRKSVAPAA
ncbi:AraC family transcriptional regulator [Streptomyces sp. NPDC013178]|uniref:AraC family transcriptional regulator n=1 Tax=Streptomyces sp. NPDC013178 TaxID=3155118 RepID=UPI0033F6B2A4